jgi:hypothetical protein
VAWTFPLETRLIRCPERQVGVWIPVPLSARLGELARIGYDAWAPTTRKEVLSALLLAASADGKKLKRLLDGYTRALVADAFVGGAEQWRFLYPPGSPGPAPQRSLFDAREGEPPHAERVADPNEQLSTTRAYRMGMLVSSPLAGRLELLVRAADEAGVRTTRKDMIAALVLSAPADAAKIAKQLSRYWHGTVSDALIPGLPEDPIVSLPQRHVRLSPEEKPMRGERRAARPGAAEQSSERRLPPGTKRSRPAKIRLPRG